MGVSCEGLGVPKGQRESWWHGGRETEGAPGASKSPERGRFIPLYAVTLGEDRAAGSSASWDVGGLLSTGFWPVWQSHMTATQAAPK